MEQFKDLKEDVESRYIALEESNPQDILDELNGLERYVGPTGLSKAIDHNVNVRYDKVKEFEAILNKFPVGTKLSQKTDAGIDYFEKVDTYSHSLLNWIHTRSPWKKKDKNTEFDMGSWMLITGLYGPFKLVEEF